MALRLLVAVASLLVEHGRQTVCALQELTAHGRIGCGSWALEHRLSSCGSAARGIFPTQGWNPRLLRWQADSSPLDHQGSPGIQC